MPRAKCPIKDKIKEDGQERFVVCTREYEVGRQVVRRVNRTRGVGICDIHGFVSVGKSVWEARAFLEGEQRLNPHLDWSLLRRDIAMCLAWYRRWWGEWPYGSVGGEKEGYLRAADDKASQMEISARKLVIEQSLKHGEALLERPAVVVQIDAKDPGQIRWLQTKQRALEATRRRIEFSVEQLREKWENVNSRALRGIEWWRTLRDAYNNANSLFSLATAYERGEAQADEHRERMAEIAAERSRTMSMGQEEELGGEAREVASVEQAEAPTAVEGVTVEAPAVAEEAATAEEAPAGEAEATSRGEPADADAAKTAAIKTVFALPGNDPMIKAKKRTEGPLKKELERAKSLMAKALEAGATFFPADAMRRLQDAAVNGGALGSIRVTQRRGRDKKKERSKAKPQ